MNTLKSIQQRPKYMMQRRGKLKANTCAAIISMLCLSHAACLAAGQGDVEKTKDAVLKRFKDIL